MPAQFDHHGISFAYPDNWSLDDSTEEVAFPCVTVSSPETAFWSLSVHPRDTDHKMLVKEAVGALREEHGNLDVEAICDEIEGQPLNGCEVNFCCLDLFSTAQIRVFQNEGRVCLLLCQAEDDEYEAMRLVFDAITTSLLRS